MALQFDNRTALRKVPIKRNTKFFSGEDFDLELNFAKEYIEQDANQTVILYRVDLEKTNLDAVYNESKAYGGRSLEEDKKLFVLLEELDRRGIKWGLSNVFTNNGISNNHLIQWCDKHGRKVYHLSITYTPFSKAKNENKTDEVFICNYCNSYELW